MRPDGQTSILGGQRGMREVLRSCDYCCDWATNGLGRQPSNDHHLRTLSTGQAALRRTAGSWRIVTAGPGGGRVHARRREDVPRPHQLATAAATGSRSLKEHDTLTAKAEAWAQHMASTGRLEHSNLSSGLSGLRWRSLGENVGYSSPTSNTLLTIHNMFVELLRHTAPTS